jgi:hypothetical protein
VSSHPPGWHPDPFRRYDLRYFNGTAWTADVSSGGHRMVDPLGAQMPATGGSPVDRPTASRRGTGFGLTAMILGIIAVTTAWMPFAFVAGAVCAVLAIVFGAIARRRRRAEGASSTTATVGLILGPIAMVLAVGGFALTLLVLDVLRPGRYEIADTSCQEVGGRQVFDGSIRNDTGRTRSYTIHVEFLRAGTNNVLDTASTDVNDVPGGGSAPWTVSVRNTGVAMDCRVDTVVGTFNFLD